MWEKRARKALANWLGLPRFLGEVREKTTSSGMTLLYLRSNLAREAVLSEQARAKNRTSFLDNRFRDREVCCHFLDIPSIWVLYSTANDPQNGPQMILDRKWSLKATANDPVKTWGMEWILWDWLQKRTDYKKETFFSRLLKKKGRRTLHLRSIYTRRKKKWNKSEKEWY